MPSITTGVAALSPDLVYFIHELLEANFNYWKESTVIKMFGDIASQSFVFNLRRDLPLQYLHPDMNIYLAKK